MTQSSNLPVPTPPEPPDPTASNYPMQKTLDSGVLDVRSVPEINITPAYLSSALFRQRYDMARNGIDQILSQLINIQKTTLRQVSVVLGTPALATYDDYMSICRAGQPLTTMAIGPAHFYFNPDFVLYFLNHLNPTDDPKLKHLRRKILVSVLMHEAQHQADGDVALYYPFRVANAEYPYRLQVIQVLGNLVFDLIHNAALSRDFDSHFKAEGLSNYADREFLSKHSDEVGTMLGELLGELGVHPHTANTFVQALHDGAYDKTRGLGQCVAYVNQANPPEIPMGGKGDDGDSDDGGAEQDGPSGSGDSSGDNGDSDGADSDGGDGSKDPDASSAGGGSGGSDAGDSSDQDASQSGSDPSSQQSQNSSQRGPCGVSGDLWNQAMQHVHVVVGMPEPDPDNPYETAAEAMQRQADGDLADIEANMHKASQMIGDEPGMFKVRTRSHRPRKQIDWRKELQDSVRASVRAGNRATLRRVRVEEAMRGIYMPVRESFTPQAAALVDISGSVVYSGKMLGEFVFTLATCVSRSGVDELKVMPFDTVCYDTMTINKSNRTRIKNQGYDFGGGGGGTSLVGPLQEFYERSLAREIPKMDKRSVLIIATDAELQVPHPQYFAKIGAGTVLWIVAQDRSYDNGLNPWAKQFIDGVRGSGYRAASRANHKLIMLR